MEILPQTSLLPRVARHLMVSILKPLWDGMWWTLRTMRRTLWGVLRELILSLEMLIKTMLAQRRKSAKVEDTENLRITPGR